MSKEQIKAARRKQAGNYAFLAPAAIIYLSVIVIPLIYSIYISFHKWNGVKAMEPVGIANYIRLFTEDDVFKTAFRNNLVWILLSVVVATALALAFALVLVKNSAAERFSAACSTSPAWWHPLRWPSSGAGCTTPTLASSTP